MPVHLQVMISPQTGSSIWRQLYVKCSPIWRQLYVKWRTNMN